MNFLPIKGRGKITARFMQTNAGTLFIGRQAEFTRLAIEEGPRFKTCQWIDGEPKQRMFCGEVVGKTANGLPSSYCPEHHARCYTKQPVDT